MKTFDFDDVQLIPKKCIVKSREECDTEIKLGKHKFKIPVVPSNMQSVVNEELCTKLAKENYFYIMHRFNFDSLAFVEKMKKQNLISSISVGVKPADFDLINNLKAKNLIPDYITIDIAHGHSESTKEIISHIRKQFNKEVFIIAGNVATPEAVQELEAWGADAIKVGVGPGKVCTTKLKTGFGTGGWQLSSIAWCSKVATKPIIADGGIRFNGDVAKAIRFGATMCMVGSLFAAHSESPGEIEIIDDVQFKQYFGSASQYNKGEKRYVEGKKELIKLRGSINDTLKEMREDLQSSISYAGGKNLGVIKLVDYVLLRNGNYYSHNND